MRLITVIVSSKNSIRTSFWLRNKGTLASGYSRHPCSWMLSSESICRSRGRDLATQSRKTKRLLDTYQYRTMHRMQTLLLFIMLYYMYMICNSIIIKLHGAIRPKGRNSKWIYELLQTWRRRCLKCCGWLPTVWGSCCSLNVYMWRHRHHQLMILINNGRLFKSQILLAYSRY